MPPMTISEKILAKHTNKNYLQPGDYIRANVDLVYGHDLTFPLSIKPFKKIGTKKVFNPNKIKIIIDHYFPSADITSAQNNKELRKFAKTHQIEILEGEGIEHVIMPEKGLVTPGDLIIGADSHTTTNGALNTFATGVGSTDLAAVMATGKEWIKVPKTIKITLTGKPGKWITGKDIILHLIKKIGVSGANYKALEFTGPAIKHLTMADRFTISNMAIEAGAKTGIFPFDEKTKKYLKNKTNKTFTPFKSDDKANYVKEIKINLSEISPKVSLPHLPENTKKIGNLTGKNVDQVVIGSCTNGRYEDLQITRTILKGKKIDPETRVLIYPGSKQIYDKALKNGIIEDLNKTGATIGPATCGPCFGGHLGILAPEETALSTTNRNFKGRMGSKKAEIMLSSPAVAAATAINGKLTNPQNLKVGK